MTAPMDIQDAAKVLRNFNDWRNDRNVQPETPAPDPKQVTQALDAAVEALEGMASAKPAFYWNPDDDTFAYAEDAGIMALKTPLYFGPQPAYCCAKCDTITDRARELIGLHMAEQEGMMLPTAKQFTNAVDALAQAIGAADQHPRERALSQDATRGSFRRGHNNDADTDGA